MYAAPFLVSLVPTKEFLNWDKWVLDDAWVDSLYDPELTGVGGIPDMLVTSDVLKDQIRNFQLMISIAVGLFNGLLIFATLMPASISLGPALIHTSQAVKKLVPESSFPPLIMVIVPLLFSPLVWSMYNILLQLVGDGWLLASLIIVAFTPIIHIVVVWKENLFAPMRGHEVVSTFNHYSTYTMALYMVALVCMLCFGYDSTLVRQLGELLTELEFDDLLNSFKDVGITQILVKTIASNFFMMAAGADFLLENMQTLHKWNIYITPKEKRSKYFQQKIEWQLQRKIGDGNESRGTEYDHDGKELLPLQEAGERKLDQILLICNDSDANVSTKSVFSMFYEGIFQIKQEMMMQSVGGKVKLRIALSNVSTDGDASGSVRARDGNRGEQQLTVTVVEAAELVGKDRVISGTRTADPYIKLYLTPRVSTTNLTAHYNSTEPRTKVQSNTLAPVWEEKFVFGPIDPTILGAKLYLNLFDRDDGSSDDSMGQIVVPLKSIQGEDEVRNSIRRLIADDPDLAAALLLTTTCSHPHNTNKQTSKHCKQRSTDQAVSLAICRHGGEATIVSTYCHACSHPRLFSLVPRKKSGTKSQTSTAARAMSSNALRRAKKKLRILLLK
jgi:hypothetical protein